MAFWRFCEWKASKYVFGSGRSANWTFPNLMVFPAMRIETFLNLMWDWRTHPKISHDRGRIQELVRGPSRVLTLGANKGAYQHQSHMQHMWHMSKKPWFKHQPRCGALSTMGAAILDYSCLKSRKSELLAGWRAAFGEPFQFSCIELARSRGGQFKLLLNFVCDTNDNDNDGMVTQISRFTSRRQQRVRLKK